MGLITKGFCIYKNSNENIQFMCSKVIIVLLDLVTTYRFCFEQASPSKTPELCPCPFLPAAPGAPKLPFDLHHREIIRILTDVYKSREARGGSAGTGDPFLPKTDDTAYLDS